MHYGIPALKALRYIILYLYTTESSIDDMLSKLCAVVFVSKQGPVRFYNNERRANILLKQFQSDKEVKIGEFNSIENKLMFETGYPLKWVSFYFL